MVSEDLDQQLVGTLLVQVHNGVIEGILVLFQPTGDVVWYLNNETIVNKAEQRRTIAEISYIASIMAQGEVSGLLAGLWWFGFLEVG